MGMTAGEWWSVAGVMFGIVSGVVTVGVVYLRLFVKTELQETEKRIADDIDKKFMSKELARLAIETQNILVSDLKKRVESMEQRENIRRR